MTETMQKLMEAIENRLYGTGVAVQAREVTKNNGVVLNAITVMPTGGMVGKNVYVDEILSMMESGEIDEYEGAEEFEEAYRQAGCEKQMDDVNTFLEIMKGTNEQFLSKVHHSMGYKKWNEQAAQEYAHREYLDFIVMYEVQLDSMSAKITNAMMEARGLTVDDLEKAAKSNEGGSFQTMEMTEVFREMGAPEEVIQEMTREPKMYVLTNASRLKGSTIMLYPEHFEELAQKENADLYIIPSSIHEVLAMAGMEDKRMLNSMVNDVNTEQVEETERLSDHVYFYKRGSMEIKIA